MPRIQLKLMAALVGLVLAATLASTWVAERSLRERELARVEESLLQRATLVRDGLPAVPFARDRTPELSAAARAAAAPSAARITLIAADGTVVADSDVPPQDLPRVENHGDREEIRSALAGATGWSTRRSATVGRRLVYVALPAGEGTGGGVVRLAVDLDHVEAAVADLRRRLLLAGGLGVAAALLLSAAIARLAVRPLSEIHEALGAIAGGDLGRRLRPHSDDEIGDIAHAVNAMAEQLGIRLEEVTAEKERLHAVLAGMVEGVLVLDREGRIVLANPRLRELLSLWGRVEGRTLLETVRHPGIDAALASARESSAPLVSEVEVGDRDPRVLLIHAAGFPEHGDRAGTVAVFHDVTELRNLENVRRDFVANASHELQTPLTAIRGFAETLRGTPVPEEQARKQLEVIIRNAERLENLIRDMMELSRIESRRIPMQPGEVDVERLARSLLIDLAPQLEKRSLAARLETAGDVPAWADRRAVEQVLTNLLDNAVKYTDPGGDIRVEIGADEQQLRIAVRDSGIGIAPEDRARIFERFYRVDQTRSRSLGGTGLGLAIVKHLVQSMEGEIFVESEPGRGSTFVFSLPRADRRPA